jgi:hypothetical protein
MHDIDRTSYELSDEYGEFGPDTELPGGTFDRAFSEAELDELATDLLQVRDEAELDQFLGTLLGKAAKAFGRFVKSPAGQALKGILKDAVKAAVPVLGGVATSMFPAGAIGTVLGGAIKSELDWEGVPGDSQDIAAAKKLIAIAGRAAQEVESELPPDAPKEAVGEKVQDVAQQQGVATPPQDTPAPTGALTSGSWTRRGRTIVIEGL